MKIIHNETGGSYSSNFLNQMYDYLRELAIDYEKCGGTTAEAAKLLRAADVVKKIQRINEDAK